jgi:hypothetical protein
MKKKLKLGQYCEVQTTAIFAKTLPNLWNCGPHPNIEFGPEEYIFTKQQPGIYRAIYKKNEDGIWVRGDRLPLVDRLDFIKYYRICSIFRNKKEFLREHFATIL